MEMTFQTTCTEKNQLLDVWYEDLEKTVGQVLVHWFIEWEVRQEGIKTTNIVVTKVLIDDNLAPMDKVKIQKDLDSGSIIPSVELDDDGTINVIFK